MLWPKIKNTAEIGFEEQIWKAASLNNNWLNKIYKYVK